MKKLTYFCDIDSLNYNEINRDSSRHLRYHDYKALRDVSFDEATEEHIAVKIMASMGLIVCLIAILFIA